jgi:hypothetical protein
VSGVATGVGGGGSQRSISATVANPGDGSGNTYGYVGDAAFGFVSGAVSPSTIKGADIKVACGLHSNLGGGIAEHWRLVLSGARAQSFFQGVTIQKTDGSCLWLPQSSVTVFDAAYTASTTAWIWTVEPWTATGTRFFLVRF